MASYNNNLGKFFSPSASYAGYVFIAVGIFMVSYSFLTLTLLLPGIFLAFTYNGTLIDTTRMKLKPYTALFGIIKTGTWIDADQFTRFSIIKATKTYSSYSRGSVKLNMNVSDIELLLINRNGTRKITLNRYKNFEEAHKEMEVLRCILLPETV
jgi:hypothetical protein